MQYSDNKEWLGFNRFLNFRHNRSRKGFQTLKGLSLPDRALTEQKRLEAYQKRVGQFKP